MATDTKKGGVSAVFAAIVSILCLVSSAKAETSKVPVWTQNNQRVFLFGANYPWYPGWEGLDLGYLNGPDAVSAIADWGQNGGRGIQPNRPPIEPGTTGFNPQGIEAQFSDMNSLGISSLRWFWGSDGRALFSIGKNGMCASLSSRTLSNLDQVVAAAERYHIKLIPVFLDFSFVTGNNHILYQGSGETSGPIHADVIRNSVKRAALITNFIAAIAYRYRNSDAILYWEIMNEAGNAVHGTDRKTGFTLNGNQCGCPTRGDCHLTLSEMRTFLNAAYDAIKSADPNHPIMPSGLARPRQLPLLLGYVKADLLGTHYIDDGSDFQKIQSVQAISDSLYAKYGVTIDKPLVMTEGPSNLGQHLDAYLNAAWQGGWAGYFPWTYQGLIGINYFKSSDTILTSQNAPVSAMPTIEFFKAFVQQHQPFIAERVFPRGGK